MSESVSHYKMVLSIKQWIINCFKDKEKLYVWCDTPEDRKSEVPCRIEGFIPDVYAKLINSSREIIGEAKTANDLDSKHTEKQLAAFLKLCSRNDGMILVLAVPWDLVRYTRSLVEYWKKKYHAENTRTIILEKLRYYF